MDGRPGLAAKRNGPLAVVTGASTGIGKELARCCAEDGFDLVIVADEPQIHEVAKELAEIGIEVRALHADLATAEGVDELIKGLDGCEVDMLLANAGRGLGRAFLDQNIDKAQFVVDTNITGTIRLIHSVGRHMRDRKSGRILITGSIAGFIPGSYQAVYNGTKAFLNSFSFALREELAQYNVIVTCLMPGATETEFFQRADMLDTHVGVANKDDAAEVAKAGYAALKRGDGNIVSGLKNKVQSAAANITPSAILAKQHAKQAAPGTAD